jgi:predicted lipoprotein with Yx(FWY)xxD motif
MSRSIALGAVLLSLAANSVVAETADRINTAGVRKTIFGEALTDTRGMTLYARTAPDACTAGCLADWRPFAAARLAKPVGAWTIVSRTDDGSLQWAYQGKPLYTSTRDQQPGDVNGDGSQGWETALLARHYVPPDVVIGNTDFGPTFITQEGKTLYFRLNFKFNAGQDVAPRHRGTGPGPEACVGECLKTWIPLKAPDNAKDQGEWTVATREDGTKQWAWRTHPLYTNVNDTKPGDLKGEGHWNINQVMAADFWEAANLTP